MRRVAVYGGTKNTYEQMTIAAKSLVANTKMDCVWFLIEDDVFPLKIPDIIHTKNVSNQIWLDPKGYNYNNAWTYMTLIRLALPEIFPDEDRILWLDVDTIVEKDIGDLFELDFKNNYVAMVEEPVRSKFPFKYHNSGVLLMNLPLIRKDNIHNKWIQLANTELFTAPDQDVINLICQGEILTIDPKWNSAGAITQNAPDPYIRHYAGYLRKSGRYVFEQYAKADWNAKTQ